MTPRSDRRREAPTLPPKRETDFPRPAQSVAGFFCAPETFDLRRSYRAPTARNDQGEKRLRDKGGERSKTRFDPGRLYRAITRHTDGRIIHVRDFLADSDAEAILIVTARGSNIRTDLWSNRGLVRRFGSPGSEPATRPASSGGDRPTQDG